MDKLDELTMASLHFAEMERRYTEALLNFMEAIEAQKSDAPLSLAHKLAEASEAWDRADNRLKKAAKRMRCYL